MISKTPIFNLQVVLRETGLKPDVLRAWERRYGMPNPQRSAGGHRLYSEYDVAVIKWLRARQTEGLTISQAVKLWEEVTSTGRDPLSGELPSSNPAVNGLPAESNRIDLMRSRWLQACMDFDALRAEDLINQSFALYPVETVCLEVLQKGLNEIGQRWYEGRATVQQEHYVTAMAMRRIEALISATPRPTRNQTILTGCPVGEWHSFPALLLSLLLRRKGLNVIYLGPNIPLDQMKETADVIRPDLIVLSAQQLRSAAAIRAAADLFHKADTPLAYGGLIFNRIPSLRSIIPAFFLGESLEEGLERIENLLVSPVPYPPGVISTKDYSAVTDAYRTRQPMIEAALMDILRDKGFSYAYMEEVNTIFGEDLLAALEMGNIADIEPDLEWLKSLMATRNIPHGALKPYLTTYRQVVERELGDAGRIITDWLSTYLAKDQMTS